MYRVTAASHVTHVCREVTRTLAKGLEHLIRNHGFILYKNIRSKYASIAVHTVRVIITVQEMNTDPTQGRREADGRRSEPEL